jgi:hypothetical protein
MNLDFAHSRPQLAGGAQSSDPLWSLNILGNPKGIVSLSPGLRGTSYPGFQFQQRKTHQPCKGCLTAPTDPLSPPCRGIDDRAGGRRSNPYRVDAPPRRTPRVARASQPWAQRSHPFRMTADWKSLLAWPVYES